jgi:hypothetical protein
MDGARGPKQRPIVRKRWVGFAAFHFALNFEPDESNPPLPVTKDGGLRLRLIRPTE